MKRIEIAMRPLAIADQKCATTPLITERTKARATIVDFSRYFLPNQAPANERKTSKQPPRSGRCCLIEQVPWNDYVRRVRARGDNPIIAREAEIAEGDMETG
ncbi:MAG: hypothetical protein ABW214_05045, partial [Terrimicrobiaceae bacterium]